MSPVNLPEKPVEYRRSRDFENEEILIKNTSHQYTSNSFDRAKVAEPPLARAANHNETLAGVKVVGKIDLNNLNAKSDPAEKPDIQKEEDRANQPVAENIVEPALEKTVN